MAFFKCKMCGGNLEITDGMSITECPYCNTTQTLPRLEDAKRINLYDRANHFRRNNEYDKAMAIYEQILNENQDDAEAYWSVVLCRYGIEYVEDSVSHKRLPTVNRMQYTSVYMDEDYKSAIQYANQEQKAVYEQEARVIDEIQKGILSISEKEEPFDVFICYKETDANGRRTPDSVLAYDLYHQLAQEGLKTFFARVTLEDKLGSAYEPYIFAALNSAKVMVVLGTKPEYFQAVWVKNEWSRYLALIKSGAKKTLVPAYKDMDPYDLPEEFSHLQALDMGKLGFIQDLLRGIKKIIRADERDKEKYIQTSIASSAASQSTAPLLERIYMFLEDGDWDNANKYCEKVLDLEPKNAEAYLGKLMVDLKIRRESDLAACTKDFENNNYYQKALRFGNQNLRNKLDNYNKQAIYSKAAKEKQEAKTADDYRNAKQLFEHLGTYSDVQKQIKECEQLICESIYQNGLRHMTLATDENTYKETAHIFENILDYKDAKQKIKECLEKAEYERKNIIYNEALNILKSVNSTDVEDTKLLKLKQTIDKFTMISEHKDSKEKILACNKLIDNIHQKKVAEERERSRLQKREERQQKILIIFAILFFIAVGIFAFIYGTG